MRKESKGWRKYRTLIVLLLMISVGVLYYFNSEANNGTKNQKKDTEVPEISKLLSKNLEESYPETPREVIRTYSRIITCFYNEKITEEELKKLAAMARQLMDDELLGKKDNAEDTYYNNLKEDIITYRAEKKTISTFILANSYDVKYKTFQGKHYAMLSCIYYTKSNAGTARTIQRYTLRKDEAGRWKILYWTFAQKDEDE